MIKRIITILLILNSLNCLAQINADEKNISIGVYGIAYPRGYTSTLFIGGLIDVSLKKHQRLCSSSSLNYNLEQFNNIDYYQNFSITSGLSWALQNKVLCFRPGIQMGYLFAERKTYATFNGVFARASTELTYKIKRVEIGLHFNLGFGYGFTNFLYYDENRLGFYSTTGFGIEFKYRFTK